MDKKSNPAILIAALVVAGLSLRLSVASVPPLLDDIRVADGLGVTAAGVLATAPVVCYGVGAWLTPKLVTDARLEALLAAGLGASAVGMAARAAPGAAPLFAGTVLAGAGAAVANVVTPSIVKRDYARPGLMMGLFALALGTSAVAAAGGTVPIAEAAGSWQWGLLAWSVPAAVGVVLVLLAARRARARPASAVVASVPRAPWRVPRAWHIAFYMAAQVMLFYSLLNWLPSFFRDQGMSATWSGLLLSIMLFVGLPASFVAPVLAARAADQRRVTAVAAGGWIVGLAGLVAAPDWVPVVWMVIIGAGQGASVGLALTFPVLRSEHELDAAALGGMAQGLGYAAGAAGALAIGLLHSAADGWTVPLLLLVAVAGMQLVAGVSAGRPGHIVTTVGTPAPAPASPR